VLQLLVAWFGLFSVLKHATLRNKKGVLTCHHNYNYHSLTGHCNYAPQPMQQHAATSTAPNLFDELVIDTALLAYRKKILPKQ